MNKLTLILALLLSGCGVDVNPKSSSYEWAQYVCKDNGGLKIVTFYPYFYPKAECNNGAVFIGLKSLFKEYRATLKTQTP